jgi:hypothetical protein
MGILKKAGIGVGVLFVAMVVAAHGGSSSSQVQPRTKVVVAPSNKPTVLGDTSEAGKSPAPSTSPTPAATIKPAATPKPTPLPTPKPTVKIVYHPPAPTAPPATVPPSKPSCDPNYSGACVPNVYPADVDCAGGSGNGPYYVQGPVQVIGTDIYGLDSNHDGVACV